MAMLAMVRNRTFPNSLLNHRNHERGARMKKLLCGAVLVLAACGSSPDEAPAAQGTGKAGAPAAASADTVAQDQVRSLLDKAILPAQSGRFAPRNDCGTPPGAAQFRERLVDAVVRRDTAAINPLSPPKIK